MRAASGDATSSGCRAWGSSGNLRVVSHEEPTNKRRPQRLTCVVRADEGGSPVDRLK
jgi:hypothetical protein